MRHIRPPEHGHRVDTPYSMAVMCGDLFCLSGQADLQAQGEVQNPGNLAAQSRAVVRHIARLVDELGCRLSDLTKLVVYYVNPGGVDEKACLASIADLLGGDALPVITPVPLSQLFYPGVMVSIDAYGLRQSGRPRLRLPGPDSPFPAALGQGEMIFVGAIRAVDDAGHPICPGDVVEQSRISLQKLDAILAFYAARRTDIVKINNWYSGRDNAEDWARGAAIRADYYPDPGPVATGLPLARLYPQGACIQTDCWIMRGENGAQLARQHSWPQGHWDWPIRLPFKHGLRCGNLIFTGGQVAMDAQANVLHPNDPAAQSKISVQNIQAVLAGLGAQWRDVIKLNAFYRAADGPANHPQQLHANLAIRSGHPHHPAAATGIPLEHLAYPGMMTEFEVIAVRQPA